MNFKRFKCSHEVERYEYAKMELDILQQKYSVMCETAELIEENFVKYENMLNRDISEYMVLYKEYMKFINNMPFPMNSFPEFSPVGMVLKVSKLIEKFEHECKNRNEIMDIYRKDFMDKIIKVENYHRSMILSNSTLHAYADKIKTKEIDIIMLLMLC